MFRLCNLGVALAALAATVPAFAQDAGMDAGFDPRAVSRANRSFTVCIGEAAKAAIGSANFENALAAACRPQEDQLLAAVAQVEGETAAAEVRVAIADQRARLLADGLQQVALR